jgi:hypothetical protein
MKTNYTPLATGVCIGGSGIEAELFHVHAVVRRSKKNTPKRLPPNRENKMCFALSL